MATVPKYSANDERITPLELFLCVNDAFGFNLDVCASKSNAKCQVFITKRDDGLSIDWSNHILDAPVFAWCNPPYSNWREWVRKAVQQRALGVTTVVLIPPWTDRQGWHDWATGADEIIFLKGRVQFDTPVETGRKSGNPDGSTLLVFRPRISNAEYGNPKLVTWDWKGI